MHLHLFAYSLRQGIRGEGGLNTIKTTPTHTRILTEFQFLCHFCCLLLVSCFCFASRPTPLRHLLNAQQVCFLTKGVDKAAMQTTTTTATKLGKESEIRLFCWSRCLWLLFFGHCHLVVFVYVVLRCTVVTNHTNE